MTRASTDLADVVTGTWKDGRVGVYRGIRKGALKYSAVVFGSKGVAPAGISWKPPRRANARTVHP